MNKNFSITFWLRNSENPSWGDPRSIIYFPPLSVNEGINVYFSKIANKLKVYVLHPDIGYRKISVDITTSLGKDTFIALTNTAEQSMLYINATLTATVPVSNQRDNLEAGDYVMLKVRENELRTLNFGSFIDVVLPGRVESINEGSVNVLFPDRDERKEFILDRLEF